MKLQFGAWADGLFCVLYKRVYIDVAVLRGRPLTHVKSLSMHNLNPFLSLFLSFFSRNLAERVHKGKKVRLFKDIHTQSTMGASIARKWTSLGRRVLRHQQAHICASSSIMTCFSCAAMVFRYSKRARIFFTYM